MKKIIEKKNPEIINVIEEFDYSTQQESYNKRFIEWRKNKNNPYTFNFVGNTKETVFIDGQGFVENSAVDAEKDVLSRILYVIGMAALAVVIIENVFDKLLVQLLDVFGVNIHNSFANSVVYGGKTEIVVVLIVLTAMKLLIPMGIVHTKFKMPLKLRCPFALNNSGELLASIAAAMIVCVVSGIPAAYSSGTKEIYSLFKSYEADMSVWGQEEFLIYTIFDVIIVSVLFEMVFRGEMFQALRQFGDVYAVVVTSVLSGLLTQNFRAMLGTMLIAAVSAVGMLRSGTILTAIFVRITYKLYLFTLDIIEMSDSDSMFIIRNLFMAAVFTVGLLVFSIIFLNKEKRNRTIFADYIAYVPMKKKLKLAMETLPLAAVVAVCLIAGALQVAA